MTTFIISAFACGLVGFIIGKIIVKACHLDKKDRRKKK